MVLYFTWLTDWETVVDFPLYFFFLVATWISFIGNRKIHKSKSIIHHHHPIKSHQSKPCLFSLYLDLVLETVVVPASSWKTCIVTLLEPQSGQIRRGASFRVSLFSILLPLCMLTKLVKFKHILDRFRLKVNRQISSILYCLQADTTLRR